MQLPSNILCGLGHRFGEKMISEMSDGMHEISDGIQTRGRKLDDGNRVVQGAWDRVWKICWHFGEMDLVVRGDRERACRAMAVGLDCSVIAHLFPIETRSDRGNPRGEANVNIRPVMRSPEPPPYPPPCVRLGATAGRARTR